jgi:hypothetical protein
MRPAAIHYQSMSGGRSERVIFPLALIGFWLLQATPEAHIGHDRDYCVSVRNFSALRSTKSPRTAF